MARADVDEEHEGKADKKFVGGDHAGGAFEIDDFGIVRRGRRAGFGIQGRPGAGVWVMGGLYSGMGGLDEGEGEGTAKMGERGEIEDGEWRMEN